MNSARSLKLEQTLQSIQRLFNRVVGVAHYEAEWRERARFVGLAYLRCSARIGQHRRQ